MNNTKQTLDLIQDSLLLMEVCPDLLYFKCIGEQNYSNTLSRFNKMYAALQQQEVTNILVEGATEKRLSLVESYNAIKKIKSILGSDLFKYKIAFLDKRVEEFDETSFAEDVATNRGFNLKIFQEKKAALEWLQKD